MHYYYLNVENQVVGPVPLVELYKLVRDSTIVPNTQLCAENTDSWLPASEILSLSKPTSMNKFPLILSAAALVVSVVAIGLKSYPTEPSISKFDFSTPSSTLRSMQQITKQADSKLRYDMNRLLSGNTKEGIYYLFYQNPDEFEIVKTVEIKDSGKKVNQGLLISFIKQKRADSVELYFTQAFSKDPQGRLIPVYYSSYVPKDKETKEDKWIKFQIDKWESEGKLE